MNKKIVIPTAKCGRCNQTWNPRKAEIKVCPKCKSPYWDKPRVRAPKKLKEKTTNDVQKVA